MKYLLIDFGASFIKCIVYDSNKHVFENSKIIESPFIKSDKINREDLNFNLLSLVNNFSNIDRILICTILGGVWKENIYYSWKSKLADQKGRYCLISGLFESKVHKDHKDFTSGTEFHNQLEQIGLIGGLPIYSSLGDTNCVIRSINLKDDEVAINIGTGSQVITNSEIVRYFPAGRSLLVFHNFFSSIGINMFSEMEKLNLNDIIKSTLKINLSNFPQARNFNSGGIVSEILESNFTFKNFIGSLIRNLVLQYSSYINNTKCVYILGGIPKKLPIIKSVFEFYYSNTKIITNESSIEDTHLGMSNMVKEML